MERSERTVRRIHHHQIRHLLLKAKIHHGNEVRMVQAGADTRFGANEIPHLLIGVATPLFIDFVRARPDSHDDTAD